MIFLKFFGMLWLSLFFLRMIFNILILLKRFSVIWRDNFKISFWYLIEFIVVFSNSNSNSGEIYSVIFKMFGLKNVFLLMLFLI